jgi:hypothetical protein
MDCPRCKLINPDSAERCDCGYDFPTKTVKESYLDKKSLRSKTAFRVPAVIVAIILVRGAMKIYSHSHADPKREKSSAELREKSYRSYNVTMTTKTGETRKDAKAFVDAVHEDCFDKAYDDPGTGGAPVTIRKAYTVCMDEALRTRVY